MCQRTLNKKNSAFLNPLSDKLIKKWMVLSSKLLSMMISVSADTADYKIGASRAPKKWPENDETKLKRLRKIRWFQIFI